MDASRLSLNQITTRGWSLREAVDGCVAAGIPAIGLWRDRLAEHDAAHGAGDAARVVRDAGLRVSSLCRGGFLTAADPDGHRAAMADNREAIEHAAEVGAACLVLVVGGLPDGDTDLDGARGRAQDVLAELVPHAKDHGVRLGLEPLHPLYVAHRSVLCTLGQALAWAEAFSADVVGVVLDTYNVFWDPEVLHGIQRAGREGRIVGVQLSDYPVTVPADALLSRCMVGDGVVDFPGLVGAIEAAGYSGDYEVEILNAGIWAEDPAGVVRTLQARFREIAPARPRPRA